MFSETNNIEHARMKRPVVKYYSLPRAIAMEGHIDKMLLELCEHIRLRFIKPGKVCELGKWISYCEPLASPQHGLRVLTYV
jgi:hypothetical protein